jgi:2-oxoglutarate dehydrogenase E2 component (dihydrolipoamide succinyltransferase)
MAAPGDRGVRVAIELKVPEIGESITEVMINQWLVAEGDQIEVDQPVAELESDKATVELPAPASGTLTKIVVQAGEMTEPGAVIGMLEPGEVAHGATDQPAAAQPAAVRESAPAAKSKPAPAQPEPVHTAASEGAGERVSPAARRLLAEEHLSPRDIEGSGRGGLILKQDVKLAAAQETETPHIQVSAEPVSTDGQEDILPMSPMRRTIARRLLESQQSTAQLTTFQEVDMSAVVELRRQYREAFQQKYDIKLGFMSFFVKASIEALKAFPAVNAEIREDNVVYRNYYNIGIAVSGDKGLVVPVLPHAERLSFAELELKIADFGARGAQNKIGLDELKGGTFTISNGGVFGSLMSTPILNPPQSGILGLHAIKDRPIALDGESVIRPMMYLALTYDHRIVDGRESVQFLLRIKEVIEDPSRILLEI